MTLDDIKHNWTSTGEKLITMNPSRLQDFNLKPETVLFLTNIGLPEDAAPFLNFVKDSACNYKNICKLTKQFDFLHPVEEFEHYIVIGSCGDGNIIAINTKKNDEVVWLDHEN